MFLSHEDEMVNPLKFYGLFFLQLFVILYQISQKETFNFWNVSMFTY